MTSSITFITKVPVSLREIDGRGMAESFALACFSAQKLTDSLFEEIKTTQKEHILASLCFLGRRKFLLDTSGYKARIRYSDVTTPCLGTEPGTKGHQHPTDSTSLVKL